MATRDPVRRRLYRAISPCLVSAIAACSPVAAPGIDRTDGLGWVDGGCFATAASAPALGSEIRLLWLGAGGIESTRLASGPLTGDACDARLAGRTGRIGGGLDASFYRVEPDPGNGVAFGVIGAPSTLRLIDGRSSVDLDGDGKRESFTICSTSEGLQLDVWPDEPRQGVALWSAYYYLGYDLEPTCP